MTESYKIQTLIRRAAAFVRGDDVIHKLFTEFAYRYKDRNGGYMRMLRSGYELVMQRKWLIFSLMIGKMNLGSRNRQLLNLHKERRWIHGLSHGFMGNILPLRRKKIA